MLQTIQITLHDPRLIFMIQGKFGERLEYRKNHKKNTGAIWWKVKMSWS